MKNKLYLILILILLYSCTTTDCVSFEEISWCYENPTEVYSSEEYITFANNKDGLFFEAKITRECDIPENIIDIYPNHFLVEKSPDMVFDVFYREETQNLGLTTITALQGIAYNKIGYKLYCIEWQGINKKKAIRLIRLLLSQNES